MIDYEKELEAILNKDPLGLLETKPTYSTVQTADARLIASFEEINKYVDEAGQEPAKSRDIQERKLFSRLKGLRDDPEKAAALLDYDRHGLLADVELPVPKKLDEIETIDDIFEDDLLGLLDSGGEAAPDIFTLKHVSAEKSKPDMVAKRQHSEEFELFEPIFKQAHAALAAKTKVTRVFNSEQQIKPGAIFILQGMLVYVANQGDWQETSDSRFDARLYCVFENGTESNMRLRSLSKRLWEDKNSRQVIDANQLHLFEKTQVNEDDVATGTIYVLRSLSKNPAIAEIDNLYKIGFSTQPTAVRIQNAATEPTFLMAEAAIVTEFEAYNVNPQKFENLLHRFFGAACLEIEVVDQDGKRHRPREWFIAPLQAIETAVRLLVSGEIVHYLYDAETEEIVPREDG